MYLSLNPFKGMANKFAWATFCIIFECIWSLLKVNMFMIDVKICIYNSFWNLIDILFIEVYFYFTQKSYPLWSIFGSIACYTMIISKLSCTSYLFVFDVAWLFALWWSCPQNEINLWIRFNNYVFHVLEIRFYCKYVFEYGKHKFTYWFINF